MVQMVEWLNPVSYAWANIILSSQNRRILYILFAIDRAFFCWNWEILWIQRRRQIEAINGAWAMIGLTAGLVIEGQTGKGILGQVNQ